MPSERKTQLKKISDVKQTQIKDNLKYKTI